MGWRGHEESCGLLLRKILEFTAYSGADSHRNLKPTYLWGLAGSKMKEEASRVEAKSCAHHDLFSLALLFVETQTETKISLLQDKQEKGDHKWHLTWPSAPGA